ncbi:MAG: phosphate ABC transporter permease PstA [Acidimicrobiales bacterium]|jgi:phosphate transport system permease protein|nr:phosphate ABC transporter permease PstA [Acidimicrobiales bacterium]MCU0296521.1 phosphate ABC transporter permease PstA [Candidatus Nanopelagicales bacterium]
MGLTTTKQTQQAVAARIQRGGTDWKGLLFQLSVLASLVVALVLLLVLLWTVFWDGIGTLTERGLDFLTSGTSGNPDTAGVWQALYGSFWIAVFVVVFAIPTGIAAAIHLEEYARDNWLNRLINTTIRNLAGVPSIVYGILGFTVFVEILDGITGGRSVIAGGFTMAVLVLPIVIITSAEALRAVPYAIREAGYGVGASQWEVIRHHVLPYALPGILTGTVLSIARALGEAAPLILVGAVTGFFASSKDASFTDELQGPFTTLPNIIYDWARQPQAGWPENTAAAIIVLLVVVLTANATAIVFRNRYDKKRHQ